MAIISPVALFSHNDAPKSALTKLMSSIDPQYQLTLKKLIHVLHAPIDSPRVTDVLKGATLCIDAFGKTLAAPNADFKKIWLDIQSVSNLLVDVSDELEQPLQRRLTKYAPWAVCMTVAQKQIPKVFLEAAGVEIALSFATGKPFPNAYANNLRRELSNEAALDTSNSQETTSSNQYTFSKHFEKALRNAQLIFEDASARSSLLVPPTQESFESRARHYLLRNQTYAQPNHRRAVLDHHCQSKSQIIQSAFELRSKAENNDDTAIITILALCIGISPALVMQMPLALHAADDWLLVIDVEAGLIKTNIDSLFPQSATPTTDSLSLHHSANKIVIKPIPAFVQCLLTKRLSKTPSAQSIGQLLPAAITSGKIFTSDQSEQGISPSTRRFLNSAAPFAIQLGTNRLVAATITNDFSVIPGSKPYYSLVAREEIWAGCSSLFDSLGWGAPMPIEPGLPVGSLVVATQHSVKSLFEWMCKEVSNSMPGRRYSFLSLVEHHNMFAKYCASLTILSLGSRQAKQLRFNATGLHEEFAFTSVFDKRTGQFPGALPVPINAVLSEQLRFWRAHCSALDSRLEKIGLDENTQLRSHIRQILNCSNVHLFFGISTNGKPFPLGSSDLTEWWPDRLRLNANFSRSFWQHELHLYGLKSSIIDLFVRHQLIGAESHTSTTHFALTNYFNQIVQAQEKILSDMNITSLSGLAKK